VREATFESLDEDDRHGRRVMGNYMRGGAHAYFDAERRIVASVRDGKPIQTYHPYEALYDWPLFAGKSWPGEFQLNIYDRNQTLDLKYAFTVEAYQLLVARTVGSHVPERKKPGASIAID
jgi:hypothetical protein